MRVATLCLALPSALLACSSDSLIWMAGRRADAIYRFVKGDKAGYIDSQGRVIIPPSFRFFGNSGGEFYEGFRTDLTGPIVDTTGKPVFTNLGLDWASRFSEGLAMVHFNGGRSPAFIDKSGRFPIERSFPAGTSLSSFSDGLAGVEINGRHGYIDRTGREVIRPKFAAGRDFTEGLARVAIQGPCYYTMHDAQDPCARLEPIWAPYAASRTAPSNARECQWNVIDKEGSLAFPRSLDYVFAYQEGLAAAQDRGLWGFIDKAGRFVIPPRFGYARSFSNGLALVETGRDRMFIDTAGKAVIHLPGEWRYASDFESGLAAACVDGFKGPCHYVDTGGRVVLPGPYKRASSFHKGIAHVALTNGDFAYINSSGRAIFTYRP